MQSRLIAEQTVPRSVRYRAKDLSQLVIRIDAAVGADYEADGSKVCKIQNKGSGTACNSGCGAVVDEDHSWQFLGVQNRIPESWYNAGCGHMEKVEEKRNPGER